MRTPARQASPWIALSALCIGFFLIMMDTTIVNIAIPGMLTHLHANLNQITWVNSVYLLSYAVPLLVAGRLGDQFGRKPMFLAGMAIFTVASLWCGLSGTVEMLVAARAVQGIGAAAMAPQTMAFITTLFPPDRRGAALGAWGAVAGVATAAGPLLGGFLVDALGWQWIFLVNVPIGLIGLAMVVRLVPGGQERRHRHFDVLGTVLSSVGLFALVFGLQNGQQYHWATVIGPITVLEVIGAGVLLLVAFVGWQRYNTHEPLMPLALFGHRNFSAGAAAAASVGFALTGLYLPLTLLLQSLLGLSPLHAGVLMLPIALGAGITGPIAGRLSDRISGKWVVLTGFLVFAAGIGMIAALVSPRMSSWTLAFALLVCGIGTGTAFSPMANVATGGIRDDLMGAASGVYNTTRQTGSVIGSAVVSVLLQAQLSTSLRSSAVTASTELPPGARQGFIDRMSRAGSSAGEFGAAPPGAGQAVANLAARAFRDGLAHAVGTTLLLPIVILLLGSTACLTMTSRTADPAPVSTTQAQETGV